MKNQKSNYSKKLLDPRWQKKRLTILSRDSFTCQDCQSTDNTLHVHHLYYEGNIDPWDYPDSALITLCCECHDFETQNLYAAERSLILAFKKSGYRAYDIDALSSLVLAPSEVIAKDMKKILMAILTDTWLSNAVYLSWSEREKYFDQMWLDIQSSGGLYKLLQDDKC